MSIHRNILVQTTPVDAAQMLDRCRSALARLDADLRLGWVNAAWQERFAAARTQLDQLDPANPAIVAAAGRARIEQRAVILREVGIDTGHDAAWCADLCFSPLADGGVLLEAHPAQVAAGQASPAL